MLIFVSVIQVMCVGQPQIFLIFVVDMNIENRQSQTNNDSSSLKNYINALRISLKVLHLEVQSITDILQDLRSTPPHDSGRYDFGDKTEIT